MPSGLMLVAFWSVHPMSQLHRLSGPSGTASIRGTTYPTEEWSIFEGDPDHEANCRGWFHCLDPAFMARRSAHVHLEVQPWQGEPRSFNVTITVNLKAHHLWEF